MTEVKSFKELFCLIAGENQTIDADDVKEGRLNKKIAKTLGIIDEIIVEPLGGAHRAKERTVAAVGDAFLKTFPTGRGVFYRDPSSSVLSSA